MTVHPCWNCRQPANHTLAREGSDTLQACDNCTRIDRAEAERLGWTITQIKPEDLALIAAGANVQLTVWGGQPPVAMRVVDTPLGKPPA